MVKFTMAHLSGIDRSQMLLLPEAVEDYVGPDDNPVRFIEAFVAVHVPHVALQLTVRMRPFTLNCCI